MFVITMIWGRILFIGYVRLCSVDEIKWDENGVLLKPLCIANNIENRNKLVPKNDIIVFVFKSKDKD